MITNTTYAADKARPITKFWLVMALQNLWDTGALLTNPLCDYFEQDERFDQAEALRQAILEGAERLRDQGAVANRAYDLLDAAYGLSQEERERFRLYPSRPSKGELVKRAGLTWEAYEQVMDAAVARLKVSLEITVFAYPDAPGRSCL